MLTKLHIENYALIDEMDVEFNKGFTTITGETGAGKSILLDALGLILGNRADSSVLQNKGVKCIVEGEFDITKYKLSRFFKKHELDYADVTILRREINQQGRSRAFINDTPVNLSQLKELTNELIDIHSQHETLSLSTTTFQFKVLDAFCGQTNEVTEYRKHYNEFKELEEKLNQLKQQEHSSLSDLDYFQFQFDELEKANLIAGEEEDAERELETLNNTEEIKESLSNAVGGLSVSEGNVLENLQQIKQLLKQVTNHSQQFEELGSRFESTLIELEDIAVELENRSESIQHDPERLQFLSERLDTIYSLQKKHKASSTEELLQVKDALEQKLSGFNSLEEDIEELEKTVEIKRKELTEIATKLSEKRKEVAPAFEEKINEQLYALGMSNASLKAHLEDDTDFNNYGLNNLQFQFTANKGSEFKPLNKVASGGELSRLMLSIRSLVAELTNLPTIIFDEIDTGVSGEIADKVGRTMQEMAHHMQVIAVTHLPQIAGKGDTHYLAYKEVRGEETVSCLQPLNDNARVEELARMLSGEKLTEAALENAKELLK